MHRRIARVLVVTGCPTAPLAAMLSVSMFGAGARVAWALPASPVEEGAS